MNETLIYSFIFTFAVMIGSFLNVAIYRIPRGESIVFPASHCPNCQKKLKWYHNIPVFSWLALTGKCAFCKADISKQYPMIELLSGFVFLALYIKLGFVWHYLFVAFSFAALLTLIMIDFKYMAVPDSVNYIALFFALIQPEFFSALLYAAAAAGGLYLIGILASFLAKRQAMGGADVIVAGTMGALLGFPNFFVAIFISAILALIPALIWREKGVPFIPFLALATFLVYLYDTQATQLLQRVIYG